MKTTILLLALLTLAPAYVAGAKGTATATPTVTASATPTATPGKAVVLPTLTPQKPKPKPKATVAPTVTPQATPTRMPTPWIYDRSELNKKGTPIVPLKGYWATPGVDKSKMEAAR